MRENEGEVYSLDFEVPCKVERMSSSARPVQRERERELSRFFCEGKKSNQFRLPTNVHLHCKEVSEKEKKKYFFQSSCEKTQRTNQIPIS